MDTRLAVAASSAVTLLALQACSHFPENIETLDQARQEVGALEKDPLAQDVAPTRLEAARAALSRADNLYEKKEDVPAIEQNSFVALRNAQIAEQQIAEKRANEQLANAQAERDKILLASKEREASQAQQLAQQRGAQLEQAQQELADLKAQQTDRGLVLTLNDVLFDTNSTHLKAGADRDIQQLADFMKENPKRDVLVEGYTDSTGSNEYNRELSAGRAEAVKRALVDRGISSDRIRTRGLGEEYPVASNDTAAGRQLNRRVEIVISDGSGRFASAQRGSVSG